MRHRAVCLAALVIVIPIGCGDDEAGGPSDTSSAKERDRPWEDAPLPQAGEKVRVAGPHGETVRCEDGKPLKVKVGGAGPGPSLREAAAAARKGRTSSDGDAVTTTPDGGVSAEAAPGGFPRCGPDGKVIWVTSAEDPLRDGKGSP